MNSDMLDKLQGMLAQNNIDPATVIDKLNKVAEDITCTGECKRNKIREQLRATWTAAKETLAKAPADEHEAEKNYFVFDQGYELYTAMIFNRYIASAQLFKKQSLAMHKTLTDELDQLLNQYTTQITLGGRIEELFMTKMEDYILLKQKLDTSEKNASTLGRKVAYEDNDGKRLHIVKKMIFFVYYGMFVLYLIFGSYFGKQQYRNKTMWWILVCYLLAPVVTHDLSTYVFDAVHWVDYMWQTKAPRNAYINL